MRRQFFSTILSGNQKFDFQKNERFMFHAISLVMAKENDTHIQIFGESGDKKFLLTTIDSNHPTAHLKLIINENTIQTLYAVGNGSVDLMGFTMLNNSYSVSQDQNVQSGDKQVENKIKKIVIQDKEPIIVKQIQEGEDIFKALKAKPERADDDIDLSRMSKKQLQRFKQNRAREAQGY